MGKQLLLGNEAIGLGLIRSGCRMVTAYPGTPSSEILSSVIRYKTHAPEVVYAEWSANEKVAFETALAASWSGLRAATAMKQVGLNVAADPFFSSAYTGVVGGFVVISCDDPGPHSSQTEQDSRLLAHAAKVPVLDPSTPVEALQMTGFAFELSERFQIPVLLRPTTRLCHARQSFDSDAVLFPATAGPQARGFQKDPQRWAATPAFRLKLHVELVQKLEAIEQEFETSELNRIQGSFGENGSAPVGVIASGVAFHTALQVLRDFGANIPVLKLGTPYPLPRRLVADFIRRCERVIVFEEPDATIELQISDRTRVRGRLDGTVPQAGELTPERAAAILAEALDEAGFPVPAPADERLTALVQAMAVPPRRPRLCPGCSHRSAYFAIKRTFGPQAIYPGDIGCYTLGTNLRAMDTCLDMGGSVTMAAGFYHAGRLLGDERPIVATIGDSTFLHAGIVPLANAVHNDARFILVILDNHTTAMTGTQPTLASAVGSDGAAALPTSIPDLVRACGVRFVREADPYDQDPFQELLKEAHSFTPAPEGGAAVIIADRPCAIFDPSPIDAHPIPVTVTEECDGCRYCVEAFECPAIVLRPDGSRVDIDLKTCVECGQCIDACYKGFIVPQVELQHA